MDTDSVKFIVSGPQRSGTTLLAYYLNSQKDSFCLEDDIRVFKDTFTEREKNILCSKIEAKYMYLGIDPPDLRSCSKKYDYRNAYFDHLRNIYKSKHIGFKSTNLNIDDLKMFDQEGFKIILMKRNFDEMFFSYLNRINDNPTVSAIKIKKYFLSINYYKLDGILSHFFVVSFEDLIQHPKHVLDQLSSFLGFSLEMPNVRYHSFNKYRKEFHKNSSFSKNGEKRLQNGLTTYEKELVKYMCGEKPSIRVNAKIKAIESKQKLISFAKIIIG